jgi:acetolactate synthase-1/3 small subunit
MSNKVVFSLLVDNEAGVLSRIAGLFSRRGYNIESLTVGETEEKSISRMTVVAEGEPEVLEQIEKQLAKLIDVRQIKMLPADSSVCRELILMKIAVNAQDRQQVIAIADIFRAKIVDVSLNSLMVELTGTQSKIDAFTNLLGQFRVLELARTGITGLSRGCTDEQ